MFSLTSFKLINAAYPEYSVQICIAVYCRIQRFDNFFCFFFLFSFLIELIQSKATNNARNSTKNMYSNSKIIVEMTCSLFPHTISVLTGCRIKQSKRSEVAKSQL